MAVKLVYRRLGKIVRARRLELAKTQEWLARRVNLTRGSIANIETGRQQVLLHTVYDLARALRLPRDMFMP